MIAMSTCVAKMMKRDTRYKPAIVYHAVNLINGKRYIGITTQSLAGRRSGHKNGFRGRHSASVFDHAIRSHGIEHFHFTILERCATRLAAAKEEIRLISALRPEYNMTGGGDNVMPPSEEQMRLFTAGRERASERRRKPVICLSDGKIFPSSVKAADAYNISRAALCFHLRGRNASAGGKLFSYFTGAEMALDDPEAAIRDLRQAQRQRFLVANEKSITCVTDGRHFKSGAEASIFYGISRALISAVVNRKRRSTKGLVFVLDDQLKMGRYYRQINHGFA